MNDVIIIKVGGSILQSDLDPLFSDIKSITKNKKVILVHGWSYAVNDMYSKLGLSPTFYTSSKGFVSRKTDSKAIDLILMVATGFLNKSLVHKLNKNGVNTVGISGIDGFVLRAERKIFRVKEGETLKKLKDDFTGKITEINNIALEQWISNYDCLVVTPIAVGANMELLSTDADRAAAQIASALKSSLLILLSNVDGYLENEKPIHHLANESLTKAIDNSSKGMKKKLWAAREALNGGVKKVIIGNGRKNEPISNLLSGLNGTQIIYQ